MTAVANYEIWLRHRAAGLVSMSDQSYDDIIQEGRIAMWRQEESLGREHAGFMTQRASQRMGQIARGEGQLGSTDKGRSGRDVKPVASLDAFDIDIEPATADLAEGVSLAYHHGEIYAAIDRLSPKQQAATRVLLRDGVMTAAQRASWVDARAKLAFELDHLRDYG